MKKFIQNKKINLTLDNKLSLILIDMVNDGIVKSNVNNIINRVFEKYVRENYHDYYVKYFEKIE